MDNESHEIEPVFLSQTTSVVGEENSPIQFAIPEMTQECQVRALYYTEVMGEIVAFGFLYTVGTGPFLLEIRLRTVCIPCGMYP